MNTALSRANAVFAYTLTVLAVLTLLCFLSTVFKSRAADVSISHSNIMLRPGLLQSRIVNDQADITFNIKANFSPLFDWNTKQLFVYLYAEYSTSNNPVNQVVLWDKIILRGEKAVIDYKEIMGKYAFMDDGSGLRGNENVSLVLSWNLIPDAGLLPLVSSSHFKIPFPDQYHQ